MDANGTTRTQPIATPNVARWRAESDPDCDLETFWRVVEDHGDGIEHTVARDLYQSEAELILRAVQSHAALLAIVREVAEIKHCACREWIPGPCIVCRARAACGRATGKDAT